MTMLLLKRLWHNPKLTYIQAATDGLCLVLGIIPALVRRLHATRLLLVVGALGAGVAPVFAQAVPAAVFDALEREVNDAQRVGPWETTLAFLVLPLVLLCAAYAWTVAGEIVRALRAPKPRGLRTVSLFDLEGAVADALARRLQTTFSVEVARLELQDDGTSATLELRVATSGSNELPRHYTLMMENIARRATSPAPP